MTGPVIEVIPVRQLLRLYSVLLLAEEKSTGTKGNAVLGWIYLLSPMKISAYDDELLVMITTTWRLTLAPWRAHESGWNRFDHSRIASVSLTER